MIIDPTAPVGWSVHVCVGSPVSVRRRRSAAGASLGPSVRQGTGDHSIFHSVLTPASVVRKSNYDLCEMS